MGVKRKPGDPPHWSSEWAKVDESGHYEGSFTPKARLIAAAIGAVVILAFALMKAMESYGR